MNDRTLENGIGPIETTPIPVRINREFTAEITAPCGCRIEASGKVSDHEWESSGLILLRRVVLTVATKSQDLGMTS